MNMQELEPQGFSQLLGMRGGQPAQQMAPAPDLAMPGMADVVNPQAQAAQSQEPGFMAKAGGYLKENPMLAQMLMQSAMSLARNEGGNFGASLGIAAADGLQGGLMYQAQQKQDAENAAKIEREQALQGQKHELDQQRVTNDSQRVDISQQQADSNDANVQSQIASRGVDVEGKDLANKEKRDTMVLRKNKLEADLDLLREKIAQAPNEREATRLRLQESRLNMNIADLKYKYEKDFGEEDRKLEQQQKRTAVGTANIQQDTAQIANAKAQQDNVDRMAMTMPERQGLVPKPVAAKADTTPEQRWDEWLKEANANKIGAKPLDIDAERSAFRKAEQMRGQGVDAPAEGAPAAGPSPQEKAMWEAARAKVKVGQAYQAPNGKTYIRKQ